MAGPENDIGNTPILLDSPKLSEGSILENTFATFFERISEYEATRAGVWKQYSNGRVGRGTRKFACLPAERSPNMEPQHRTVVGSECSLWAGMVSAVRFPLTTREGEAYGSNACDDFRGRSAN
jgi:hypothetical protein